MCTQTLPQSTDCAAAAGIWRREFSMQSIPAEEQKDTPNGRRPQPPQPTSPFSVRRKNRLFVAERVDGLESRRPYRRVESKTETNGDRNPAGEDDGDRRDVCTPSGISR